MTSEQPTGEPLSFTPAARPARRELRGREIILRPLDAARDAETLYEESHPPLAPPGLWTYLFTGPYADVAELQADLAEKERSEDPLFFTLVRASDARPVGLAAYMRITPEHGVIEIGNIWFGGSLQRTSAASEAIYLLAAHVFDELGYRRLEWKCDALNAASRRAAARFGFTYEGVFRQHMVVKGRNRDTAWFAVTDREWPPIAEGFRAWLDPDNHGPDGRQRRGLGELIALARG